MKTVREGWVVFDDGGQQINGPDVNEQEAWESASNGCTSSQQWMRHHNYTCRRVRVTIEELDEKGE